MPTHMDILYRLYMHMYMCEITPVCGHKQRSERAGLPDVSYYCIALAKSSWSLSLLSVSRSISLSVCLSICLSVSVSLMGIMRDS